MGSTYSKILCCNCHDNLKKEIELENKIKDGRAIKKKLDPKERDALEFIEKRYFNGNSIPLASYINFFGTFGFKANDGHIIGLGLSNCGLTRIPVEVSVFKRLKFLDLDNNNIINLPQWLESLSSLEWLNIYDNKIKMDTNSLNVLSHLQQFNDHFFLISKEYFRTINLGLLIGISNFLKKTSGKTSS